jgi:hypothetical protein
MAACKVIKRYILEHYGPTCGDLFVETLRLILCTSYFELMIDSTFKQNGIPTGDLAAPSIATLFIAYY